MADDHGLRYTKNTSKFIATKNRESDILSIENVVQFVGQKKTKYLPATDDEIWANNPI